METSNYSNPESLAVLTAMVNQTLVEMGRFFRAGGSTQARARFKKTIPAAHERFQAALDDLSEQIFIAKAFLERDYEGIRAEKAALQPAQEVAMDEPSNRSENEGAQEPPQKIEEVTETKPLESQLDEEPTTVQEPLTGDKPSQETEGKIVKVEKQEGQSSAPDQSVPGTTEINFDSMLNDGGSGPNEFDLHLDFGDDDIGNQNFLSGSSLGNTGIGGDIGQETDQSGAMASMFSKEGDNLGSGPTGGDAFDLEFQKTDGFPGQDQQAGGQMSNNADDVMAPGESSFDDLFMENENFGEGLGDQNLLGDGLMNINELDDNWFT
ncbi:hypothetical protein CNMCM6936_002764 [Aspergillus lentulus]|uniref:Uncharacterized protein n=2 Tax=Aspergillus lentulus TaxID=293939 RepID=A0AAN5YS60_ASPLE|nr:hypothetical protein CNMCM6936_002764 [Aspergillus lentulus]KAF4178853.1 hypothetical protein CNMCM8060_003962 [Aspergillus lentulus]KAF4187486.1 hypothetical protein CNMCM7927_003959 [Aspergillus lentulus]KAF4196635.1 hypothetical protein CNMCM8694_004583 [Aspergillus lentulus]KAF4207157.1 hypothetical protein CNMCM8927_003728 [Aspergillus lentulus]